MAPDVVDVVSTLDCCYEPRAWAFATQRVAIERHWKDAVRARPHLFNGRVLMLTRGGVEPAPKGAVFRGTFADTDFAAFLAFRDFGRPGGGWRNGFGMAALQAADGAFLLGEMAAHTVNAGRIYFPSGTPDLGDVEGSRVDMAGSVRRELAEETGLDPVTLAFDETFTVLQDAARACIFQRVRAAEDADALAARIHAALAADPLPELTRMHIVRTPADITPAMPDFVALYLRRALKDQPG